MNKFNKIFRKSMAIPQNGSNDYNSSSASSPPKSSYMSHNLSHSGGSINNSSLSSSPSSNIENRQVFGGSSINLTSGIQPIGGGSGGGGGSITASSASAINLTTPKTISSSGSMINLSSINSGGQSQSNLYSQYSPLSCIDFDQIFSQYINDSNDQIKSYFLVHSILSKKVLDSTTNRDERSGSGSGNNNNNNNSEDTSAKSSWQPFYKKNSNISFLILCSKSIIILDANTTPFTITKRIPICDIKEIIFETSDLGVFSIELIQPNSQLNNNNNNDNNNINSNNNNNIATTSNIPQTVNSPNILFFTVGCEKKEIHEQLNQSFDEVLKDYYKNKDIFVLKKCNMLGTVDQSHKKEFKDFVNQTLDEMSMFGFTAQDLWEGNADLKFWVDKIKHRIVLNNDERFVVEFVLPENLNENNNNSNNNNLNNNNNINSVCKRIYRVPNDISIKDITNFLCIKTQTIQDSSIYTLATIKGKELDGDDILADYGLGSFFDSWQLVLVERGKTRRAGIFNLEVHFPDNPEYRGRYHRVLELDGYMTASKLVKYIGEQMDIAKSHLYCIRLDVVLSSNPNSSPTLPSSHTNSNTPTSIILDDDDYLTTHGLGSKFLKCKLKLLPKKFPKPSKDKKINYEITSLIVNDIVENAWKVYNQRKEEKASILCNEILESIIDIAVTECKRASTLSLRMASMSSIGRAHLYKLLAQKEQEELNFYKIEGQKTVANEAKDLLNSLTPINIPNGSGIQLDDENKSSLLHRVAPPPPPPLLGFKDFKPKKKSTIDDSSSSSSSSASHIKSTPMGSMLDMSQILSQRSKLRVMKKDDSTTTTTPPSINDNKVNFTLRNTKSFVKPNQVTNETNELMLKLQKRNAAVAVDAEDLGDS
ncbi:hypothetical protein ACTFIU_006964 [Dictyostelium citrinum]